MWAGTFVSHLHKENRKLNISRFWPVGLFYLIYLTVRCFTSHSVFIHIRRPSTLWRGESRAAPGENPRPSAGWKKINQNGKYKFYHNIFSKNQAGQSKRYCVLMSWKKLSFQRFCLTPRFETAVPQSFKVCWQLEIVQKVLLKRLCSITLIHNVRKV